MESQLQNVLKRLAGAQNASAPTEADREVIRRAIADDAEPTKSGTQPLWSWCRQAEFRFQAVLAKVFPRFDSRVNAVLIDAGARPDALTSPLLRMTARVDRKSFVRAVRRQLNDKNASQRQIAAQLVGFAGITELQELLEESLKTDQEQQRDNSSEVVAAGLDSLLVLGSPVARTQGRRRLGAPDRTLQSAAERAVLFGDEPLDDATLERVVKGQLKDTWFKAAPTEMARAVEHGFVDAAGVHGWLDGQWHNLVALQVVARALATASCADGFKVLCEAGKEHGLCAGAWSVAFGGHDWALPTLRASFETANPKSLGARLLVTAIASHDFGALRGWLDTEHQAGALLGLVAWRERREEAVKLLEGLTIRSKHGRVLFGMVEALLAKQRDPDLLERCWWRLLGLDDPWPARMLAQAFDAYGWSLPEAVQLWRAADEPLEVTSRQRLDALVEMARRDPTILLRRLRDGQGHEPQWRRCASLLGMSGHPEGIAELRQHVATQDNRDGCCHLARVMTAAGTLATGDVHARLSSSDLGLGEALEPGDVSEALIAAMQGNDLARVAGLSLSTVADEAAPFLRWQLAGNNTGRRELAVQTAARVTTAEDPHVSDITALANSEVKHVSELSCPELLLASPAGDVREMLATLVGRPPHRLEDVAPLLLPLMSDEEEAVSWAALSGLASLAPDKPWVTDLILERSQSDHWEAARRSAAVMACAPHPRFIARLTELAGNEQSDYTARENAVTALTRIAEDFPDRGLVVLDVRQPNHVQERYGLADQIDWQADRHSEATRLLLVAFDQRRREELSRQHLGKKILFAAPDETNAGNPAHIGSALFEGLAMYFGVVFADEDTGSIIAEVREESSGEIFNALLQTRSVAVARASWS